MRRSILMQGVNPAMQRMILSNSGNLQIPTSATPAWQAGTGMHVTRLHGQPNTGKQGKALLKLRYLIQKHFLTGFPHSMKKAAHDPFDFVFIAKLAGLNRALAESL